MGVLTFGAGVAGTTGFGDFFLARRRKNEKMGIMHLKQFKAFIQAC
jgi:hypothetical protein